LTLSLDLQSAKKILVGERQGFVKAPGALALKMRFFPAQGDEELTIVSFAHKSLHSCPCDEVHSAARSVEWQFDAVSPMIRRKR
jgi:hypothetical protein